MKLPLLFVVVAMFVVAAAAEEKKVTKLQIGVKKRVEDCQVRSKKGDKLHMHYTVRL